MIEKTLENTFCIKGTLDFDNIDSLLQKACELIAKETSPQHEVTFNFSEVTQSNSAGLALLTGLFRYGKERQQTVQFLHVPAKLWSAAKLSDLDKVLPCA